MFLSDEEYDRIYGQVPRLCVDLVIRNSYKAILLTRRDIEPYKGLWHFPGGRIDFKGKVADAANRIAVKELGVEVKIVRTLGTCEIMNDDVSPEKPRHSVSVVVECEITRRTPRPVKEATEASYFHAMPTEVHPYHGAFLKENGLL